MGIRRDGENGEDQINGKDQIICEEENQLSSFQIVGIFLLKPLSHRYAQ